MKHTLFTLFFLTSGFCSTLSAQDFSMKDVPYNTEKEKVIYEGNIEIENPISKEALYEKTINALKVIVKGFSSKIVKNDPVEGLLIYNGILQAMVKDPATGDQIPEARVKYIVHLSASENTLKYSISNFVVEKGLKKPLESYYFNAPDVKMKADAHEDFFHSIDYEMKNFVKSLNRRINSK
jgi:hypothetical protein